MLRQNTKPGGALRNDVHVELRRVHVRRSHEAAAQRRDGVAVAPKQLAAFLAARDLAHCEHRLAATERHAGDGQLRRHRLGKPHRVGKAVLRRRVHPQTCAPARRTEPGGVHADEHPRTGRSVVGDDDSLTVPRADQLLEHATSLVALHA